MKKIVLLLNLFICFIIIIPGNILAYDSIDFYSEKVILLIWCFSLLFQKKMIK